jgi:hypothetical protein
MSEVAPGSVVKDGVARLVHGGPASAPEAINACAGDALSPQLWSSS